METQPKNNRTGNLSWIWGGVLIALGAVFLLNQLMPRAFGVLIPVVILSGIGMTFFSVYWSNRQHWWALIPAYVMWAISGLILVGGWFNGALLGFLVPFSFGIPFLYVYWRDHEQWWALIPGYMFTALGIVIISGIFFGDQILGVLIPLAFALPFFYVYVHNRQHWWALIPAGFAASIALGFLMAGVMRFIPVLMIIAGIYLLVRQRSGRETKPIKTKSANPEFYPIMPETGPEAERTSHEDFVPLGLNGKIDR